MGDSTMNVAEQYTITTKNQVRPTSPTTGQDRDSLGAGRTSFQRDWPKSFEELEALRGLADGWDGEGTTAPSSAIIDSARELLQELQQMRRVRILCPTAIAAGPTGSILFAWYWGKRYFEIEIVAPYRAEWLRSEPGVPSKGGSSLSESVKALVEWTIF
jgi:hypothetical protein